MNDQAAFWPWSISTDPNRTFARALMVLGLLAAVLDVAAAEYIGEETCLVCHQVSGEQFGHTRHAGAFRTNAQTELERRVCESCHGPGSDHQLDPTAPGAIVGFSSDSGDLEQQNGMCLACHQGGGRTHWAGSIHEAADLACSDCHNPMVRVSVDSALRVSSINETCLSCHQQQRLEFRKRSHMPVLEGVMTCADCHQPHGSPTRALLRGETVNQTCYECHQERRGPFIWEHAPVREDCMNCHRPHGSNHESLLVTAQPFLCQQCHMQLRHPAALQTPGSLPGANFDARLGNRSCRNCHTQIHGSNHPAGAQLMR